MPADVPVGLNLQEEPASARRDANGAWEFSPGAARALREYLEAHPELVSAVLRSAHRDAAEGSGTLRVGRFIRGVPTNVAHRARAWRDARLPAKLLALDAALEPPTRSPGKPRKPSSSGKRGDAEDRSAPRRDGASSGGAWGEKKPDAAQSAATEKAPVVLVPAGPPAVPAWGGAAKVTSGAAATGAAGPNLSDILSEQTATAAAREARGAAALFETRAAAPSVETGAQSGRSPLAVQTRTGRRETGAAGAKGAIRAKGAVGAKGAAVSGSDARKGGWAAMVRGKESGSPAPVWAMRDALPATNASAGAPAPPRLPKITPERLAAEARRSKVDQFGKIKCLVCGRMFKSYRPLEQHLVASHYGLNSTEAKAIEAAMLASGRAVPGDGSAKTTKTERVAVQFGEILQQPRSRPGDAPVATLAANLSAYIREAKPSKRDRREAAPASGKPKVGGQMVINPNQAMSSGVVHRRGKEHEGGKKKKRPTKLKRIILKERSERLEAEEAEKAAREWEVLVEIGRVYLNLVVEEDEARARVDLVYLEDDDNTDDEEEAKKEETSGENPPADEEEAKEEETSGDNPPADEEEAKEEETSGERQTGETAPPREEIETTPPAEETTKGEASKSVGSEPTPVVSRGDAVSAAPPSSPWGGAIAFKDALMGARIPDDAAPDSSAKPKKKSKPPRGDGPREKGVVRTCEVCGVTCSGEDAWQSHLVGKNHAKAERRKAAEAAEAAEGGKKPEEKKNPNNSITYVGTDVQIRYADQVISVELNASVVACLGELKRFQDRAYFKDPVKAKMRRRLVFGLREVTKAVQLKRAKAVVVAPNIERIESEGGLDEVINQIIADADANDVPKIFALTRNRLGQIVGKRMRISAIAVLDHNGADEQFKEMLAAAAAGRALFHKNKEEIMKREEEARNEAKAEAEKKAQEEREAEAKEKEEAKKAAEGDSLSLNVAAAEFIPKMAIERVRAGKTE